MIFHDNKFFIFSAMALILPNTALLHAGTTSSRLTTAAVVALPMLGMGLSDAGPALNGELTFSNVSSETFIHFLDHSPLERALPSVPHAPEHLIEPGEDLSVPELQGQGAGVGTEADPLSREVAEAHAHFSSVTYPEEAQGPWDETQRKSWDGPHSFRDLAHQDDLLYLSEEDWDPVEIFFLQARAQWGAALKRVAGMDAAVLATLSKYSSASQGKRREVFVDGLWTIKHWVYELTLELEVAKKEMKKVHKIYVENFGQFSGQPITILSEPDQEEVLKVMELERHHEQRVTFISEALVRFWDRIVPLELKINPRPPRQCFPDTDPRKAHIKSPAKAEDPAVKKKLAKEELRAKLRAKIRRKTNPSAGMHS